MLRFSLLVVIILAGLVAVAPRSADASCGDWLAHSSGDDEAAAVQHSETVNPSPPATPRPCNGPGCRQSPSGPAPSPVAPPTEGFHHEVACLNCCNGNDLSLGVDALSEVDFVLPSGCPLGIDRPPQV